MLEDFSCLIFDMDGLLLDSEPLAKKAFDSVCQDYGLGDQSELFMQFIGSNTEKGNSIIKQALDASIDVDLFNKTWRDRYAKRVRDAAIPLKEGVMDLLVYLKSIDIPLAVATSTQTNIATHKLDMVGIAEHFEVIIGGDMVNKSKPEPDIYLMAARALGCEPRDCLAFEDSPNGVRAAVSAGMTVVQIPDLLQPDDNLRSLGHIILGRISDVMSFDFRAYRALA